MCGANYGESWVRVEGLLNALEMLKNFGKYQGGEIERGCFHNARNNLFLSGVPPNAYLENIPAVYVKCFRAEMDLIGPI